MNPERLVECVPNFSDGRRRAVIAESVALAEEAGRRLVAEAGIPVYFYGAAARRPERAALPAVRGRGFEALRGAAPADRARAPDLGGPALHPSAGATAVGVRPFLVAYNVDLASDDLALARSIAAAVRERDGGLPAVRALGFPLPRRGRVRRPGRRRGGRLGDRRPGPRGRARRCGSRRAAPPRLLARPGPRAAAHRRPGRPRRGRRGVSWHPRLGEHPWLEPYAAATNVPGGGSAAAVAGALGCALLGMAARAGARKRDGAPAAALDDLAADADRLRARFLTNERAEADAYERMVATGRAARAAAADAVAARAAEAAAVAATQVPLDTAELAARGLDLAE